MAFPIDDRPITAPVVSAAIGQPDKQYDPGSGPTGQGDTPDPNVDIKWLEMVLTDAERAEREWRRRGREIVQIYRNDWTTGTRAPKRRYNGDINFNILYSNTEVMLPAIYQNPPKPVVKSRFTGGGMPVMLPPAAQPPMGPPLMAGPGMGAPPPQQPFGAPTPPDYGIPPPPPMPTPGPPLTAPGGPLPPPIGGGMPGGMPPGLPPGVPPTMNALQTNPLTPPPPSRPDQKDIETAAAVMEKALEIVVSDKASHAAIQTSVKDMLLPGRGVCRVRWNPIISTVPIPDPVMGGPLNLPGQPNTPQTEEKKVWETVGDEYVYWEDLLLDPVRQANDMQWIAFRHLFTKEQLRQEFQGNKAFDDLVAAGRIDTLLMWTEESAAKSPPSGGSSIKSTRTLGDSIRKAMVWEVWDKINFRIIWYIRETGGLVLRVDPDSLQLDGFFPIPVPLLAVTSSDSRIPKPFYDMYAQLAEDLDETSKRIGKLTKQIKVRGGYNSASNEIADILLADDGKMIAVDGVDMLSGGLAAHMWLLPIVEWVQALQQLYIARDQQKNAIYEVMGISDIMRGATKASETATAQRIKGTMGTIRLSDQRDNAAEFALDLMQLKAQIIAKNFDADTLEKMTGETVTPQVLAILRSDFQRTCSIDIETDSTVSVDEQQEQQSMAMVMQAIQAVMQGMQGMLMSGILPPQQVVMLGLEMLKMALHPIRYSRGVIELINDFTEQLQAQMQLGMVPPPQPGGPQGAPPPRGSPQMHGAPLNAPTPSGPGHPPFRPNGGAPPPAPGA